MDGKKNIFVIVGTAGTGKTTFCASLYNWLSKNKLEIDRNTGLNKFIYSVNLDPAVEMVSMPLNYDIRDEIEYEDVIEENNLGPNGAIIASLNLLALKIDSLITNIEKSPAENIIIDTPGQVEIFTWSSSGEIILNLLNTIKNAQVHLLFAIDNFENQDINRFLINLMFSTAVKCRFDIPFYILLTKLDLLKNDNIIRWMDSYDEILKDIDDSEMEGITLSSIGLHFEKLYAKLNYIKISAKTGEGKEEFFNKFNLNYCLNIFLVQKVLFPSLNVRFAH